MSDRDLNEVVAFTLAQAEGVSLETWQDERPVRDTYRERARGLMEALHKAGVRTSIRSSKTVESKLAFIRTWQPRPAYNLALETAEEPDPDAEDQTKTEP